MAVQSNPVNFKMKTLSICRVLLTVISLIVGWLARDGDSRLVNCKASDREALIDFRSGLDDPRKLLASWKGSNCCRWWGIGCNNRTGSVVIIDVHNVDQLPETYGLGGEIKASLARIESLEYLDLSFNAFTGHPIPKFFHSFEKLQYLNLAYAGFGGKVPQTLGNISTLKYLDISADGPRLPLVVNDLKWMKGLTSLTDLSLNGVNLSMAGSELIGAINTLPHLTHVYLSDCELESSTGRDSIDNHSSLSVVDLSFNSFRSFPGWLANISSLVNVDLSFNNMEGSIPLRFTKLPNLQVLYLNGNSLNVSTNQLFDHSWRKLEVIQLSDNSVHGKLPASIGNITSLTHLELTANYIEGNFPSSLGKLCNLKFMDLSSNDLTGKLPEVLQGPKKNSPCKSPLFHLQNLVLSNNHFTGKLPNWLGQLQNLVELSLDSNKFHGSVPAAIGALKRLAILSLQENELNGTLPDNLGEMSNLSTLDVSSNHLTGIIPKSLGKLSKLSTLDVSSNHLTGVISESHFAELKNLKVLSLSFNSFVFRVSSKWVPPFQIESLLMPSCNLGPSFPRWLKSQKQIVDLYLSNANISDSIPAWFWDISGNLSYLNFSYNQLKGRLPNTIFVDFNAFVDLSFNQFEGPVPLPNNQIIILNLSNNKLSGPIPENLGVMSFLKFFSLARNQITGQIPTSIGEMTVVEVIDLPWNNLTGRIPERIGDCLYLRVLDLQNNSLTGTIPSSLGQLYNLQIIHLRNNMILGKLPSTIKGLASLETLDLGYNRLIGKVPKWIADSFPVLRILILRSNAFSGEIPYELMNLTSLQVLDLAENKLRGTIPTNLNNLDAMTREHNNYEDLSYGYTAGTYYEESIVVYTKGNSLEYTRTLSFLTCIDISGNYLHGELPLEITQLAGLVVLNLTRNHMTGQIPENIQNYVNWHPLISQAICFQEQSLQAWFQCHFWSI